MSQFKFLDTDDKSEPLKAQIEWKKCEEVVFSENLNIPKHTSDIEDIKSIGISDIILKYFKHEGILKLLNKCSDLEDISILKAEQKHSDLLPALYEGGLKVWECTYDILKQLDEKNLSFNNKYCLDLGCGSGLIGIYCLLQGAICTFQDYNIEVIKHLTIPNVLLNQNSIMNCKFFAGDWASFNDLLTNSLNEHKFDYIFTSETIYNIDNYPKICNIFKSLLKRTGIIYLAAKSYYFGVGGGIAVFQKYLDETKIFKYETHWENSEGVKRSILKITFI